LVYWGTRQTTDNFTNHKTQSDKLRTNYDKFYLRSSITKSLINYVQIMINFSYGVQLQSQMNEYKIQLFSDNNKLK